MRNLRCLFAFFVFLALPAVGNAINLESFQVTICSPEGCESLDLNEGTARIEKLREAAVKEAVAELQDGSQKQQSQRCWICPETQEPPPDPNVPGDFCTGLRHEYRFYDNDALGGVAAAYNWCLAQGSWSKLCRTTSGTPGSFVDVTAWHPYQGECMRICDVCK